MIQTTADTREINAVARTSVKQVPALFKAIAWQPGTRNLDFGGGRYDVATNYLADAGVHSYVFDPYNRTPEHNQAVVDAMTAQPADTVTVANVLNVIQDAGIRLDVIANAGAMVKPGGKIYFSVYEGDRSGCGARTSAGTWQENRKLSSYFAEIFAVYQDVCVHHGYIVATNNRTPDKVF